MLDFLTANKLLSTALIAGFAAFFGLTSYWAARNAADARTDMLYGHYEYAFEKYQRAAKKGDAAAQNSLGNLYYMGLGVKRNYDSAAYWYKRAAINNNKPALINMGVLHFQGRGVKSDLLKAYAWFRLGDKAGQKGAIIHLKYLTGINLITPNMMQKAQQIYKDVASLTRKTDTKLHSFKGQPHLPTSDDDRRIRPTQGNTETQER